MKAESKFSVTGELVGMRIDLAIATALPNLSRSAARNLLRLGAVFLDGKRTKRESRVLFEGQQVLVHSTGLDLKAVKAEADVTLPLLYEDEDALVIDKPSGLFSAPTPESDLNSALKILERGRAAPLHIIHRLDRPTSGVLLFAKHKSAAAYFSRLFHDHSLTRRYFALLYGTLEATTVVDSPIEGKNAKTTFEPMTSHGGATLVRATLETGRTHQVRIHAEALGSPVLGDSKYGRKQLRRVSVRAPRLCLHATELGLTLPSGEEKTFTSALPEALLTYFDQLKLADD